MTDGAIQNNLTSDAGRRLKSFLEDAGAETGLQPLTPDASTREYFRVSWEGETRVACVYQEPFGDDLPFLDTSALFRTAGLPVATIVHVSGDKGIVIQEDLGDTPLSGFMGTTDASLREEMIGKAISLIADIQAATQIAYEMGSIASKLKFDKEKFEWELDFFLKHYFGSLKNLPLPRSLENNVREEFSALAEELERFSRDLTHRDFHAANLLVGKELDLWIIDHQDARIGSPAYDLVSLLLDRITDAPDNNWLTGKMEFLLYERGKAGLPGIGLDEFAYEFDLSAIQRCLKAIGTFSNQAGNFGKTRYTVYIDPMFGIVSGICKKLGRFPAVREMITLHTRE